jgi:hypothetical protein
MLRLDRGIQYSAADVVTADAPTPASAILDRAVEPDDDTVWVAIHSPGREVINAKNPGDVSISGASSSLVV